MRREVEEKGQKRRAEVTMGGRHPVRFSFFCIHKAGRLLPFGFCRLNLVCFGGCSGSASPKKASSSLKRTDSSTSSDKPSSSRPVAPLPKANPPPTSSSSKAPPKLKPEPNFVKRTSAAPASPSPPPTSGKEEVNPALPTIVLPYPAKPRTHAGDKAANAGTGENLRDKSVELIYNSLAGDSRAGALLPFYRTPCWRKPSNPACELKFFVTIVSDPRQTGVSCSTSPN